MLGPGRPAPTGRHPQRLQVGHWTCFGRFGGRRHLGRHLPGKRLGHEVSSVKDAAPLPLRRRPDQAQGHWTKVWGRTCHLCKHGHHQTQRSTPLRAWHCIQHANHQGYLSNCKLMRQAQGRGLDSSHPHLEPRSHWPNWKGGGTPKTQVSSPASSKSSPLRAGPKLQHLQLSHLSCCCFLWICSIHVPAAIICGGWRPPLGDAGMGQGGTLRRRRDGAGGPPASGTSLTPARASVWSAQDTEDMGSQECYPG